MLRVVQGPPGLRWFGLLNPADAPHAIRHTRTPLRLRRVVTRIPRLRALLWAWVEKLRGGEGTKKESPTSIRRKGYFAGTPRAQTPGARVGWPFSMDISPLSLIGTSFMVSAPAPTPSI